MPLDKPDPRLLAAIRRSGWAPASPEAKRRWVEGKSAQSRRMRVALAPPLQELKELIESDGELYMCINRMLAVGTPVMDLSEMLRLMNQIISEPPPYGGEVGVPFYMMFMEEMNTQEGFTAFLADKLNVQFKKIFDYWAEYLSSPESTSVLTTEEGGWLSSEAIARLEDGYDGASFAQIYKCDPTQPSWGYKSWDDFFVREFNEGVRAVELADDPRVINAACESSFFNLAKDVKDMDEFWIKGQPYSLRHMLNDDPDYLSLFSGGTVFQGFLEATGYHRWHAPVDGTIKKIVMVPGTYFLQSPALIGAPNDDYPYVQSIGFITAVTARMLMFIESSNPTIGMMCVVAVGMVEVSSCEATVTIGQKVKKGDELGMFHFGGSTHCLVFRAGANIQFDGAVTEPGALCKVRGAIGVAQG